MSWIQEREQTIISKNEGDEESQKIEELQEDRWTMRVVGGKKVVNGFGLSRGVAERDGDIENLS